MEAGAAIGGSALSSLFQLANSAIMSVINNAYWKRNFDYQFAAQKDLFDYEAEYNSPKNQMQRLAAAGLNPNLVLGTSSPGGVAGNIAVPSGASPGGGSFSSPDVAAAIAHLSQSRSLEADAKLKEAQANFYNKQSGRYDELIDAQIDVARAQTNKLAGELNVQEADANLKSAQALLALSEERFRSGEINLQEYRRQELVAQTELFKAQKSKVNWEASIAESEAEIARLDAKYHTLLYNDDGTMRDMTEAERQYILNSLKKDAAESAAKIGIEGSKTAAWINYITTQLGRISGAASSSGSAYRNFKRK